MAHWHNRADKPLAADEWLEAHHRAKLVERTAFAHRLAQLSPASVLDLGCGSGLWLGLLDRILPESCSFVGVDCDDGALNSARARAAAWSRPYEFVRMDIEEQASDLPWAELTLAFNVFSYIQGLGQFIATLAGRGGTLAVREYDGAAIRFGPMDTAVRQAMETSLRASLQGSAEFEHYNLDRTFRLLSESPFAAREIGFELFARTSPFPPEFKDYYTRTLAWTRDLVSDADADALRPWIDGGSDPSPRYFFEVDLVALLS